MNKNSKDDISQNNVNNKSEVEDTIDTDTKLKDELPKKTHQEKSLFEMAKDIEEKERIREAELERKAIEQHEKERDDYAKKLQQDKIELIKLKQGTINHSETIHEIHEETPVLTFPQKVSNFFYHNIWWLWIVIFITLVAGIIIYDTVTTPKPDATVLMFITNEELGNYYYENIGDYFEQFIEDNNNDGKSTVSIYYIPLNIDENDRLFTSYMAKFSGEMQSANSLIVLADDSCDERLFPKDILYDLTNDFGEYENVDGYKYYLKDTSFAETIGYDGILGDDVYIGIRKVQKVFDSSEKMQKNFDIALELFNNLITYEEKGVMNIG